ncbi:MAG: tetratricopeptide repeat protein [Cyclobacteriaceae bacterium]|nr:tetratricopeptide repeat protein [Cyclobacteriaceae bacterium]
MKILFFINTVLFTGLLLLMASCNLSKKDNDQKAKNDTRSRDSSTIVENRAATKSSGTFEEFLLKKSEIELLVYSTHADDPFDMEEAIRLRVELCNPRFLTFKTYQNTLGANQPKPEFTDLIVGTETHPWQGNLTLYFLTDGKEVPVSFAVAYPSEYNILNIGQGEIGSLGIILQPGTFSSEGKLSLRLKYTEPNKDVALMSETLITLKKDYADELQKKISMIYYLIATGKKQDALELSLESVQSWPESYHTNVLLGEIYEENGQLEKALAAYRKGILLFKTDREDRHVEFPKDLWDKIHELETKLEK